MYITGPFLPGQPVSYVYIGMVLYIYICFITHGSARELRVYRYGLARELQRTGGGIS